MKYFITGHTGFKGSWLITLLSKLGHEVHGYALDPSENSLFLKAELDTVLASDVRGDIRDFEFLKKTLEEVNPDVVIHLAAQPFVRYGYKFPEDTFSTNTQGTANTLAACKNLDRLSALVVVTTDKVYLKSNDSSAHTEEDPLGGLDPYSASKAAADLIAQSWSHTYPDVPLAVARAGNVIGGGDAGVDRLVPDLLSAFSKGEVASIRNPSFIRPWQHVLDCLQGYLLLANEIQESGIRGAWNFGPTPESYQSVSDVADRLGDLWGESASWVQDAHFDTLTETQFLTLDSSKARKYLGWTDQFSFDQALEDTVFWQKETLRGKSAKSAMHESIERHLDAK